MLQGFAPTLRAGASLWWEFGCRGVPARCAADELGRGVLTSRTGVAPSWPPHPPPTVVAGETATAGDARGGGGGIDTRAWCSSQDFFAFGVTFSALFAPPRFSAERAALTLRRFASAASRRCSM